MNEVLRAIRSRRSTRKFKIEQIKKEQIEAILEAGIYAPSAHNDQSWNFTVIRNEEILEEINTKSKKEAEDHEDKILRKMANNPELNIFYNAPTVVIVSGDENAMMPETDCAAATENMLIAAESLNIGSCWCGFVKFLFESEKGTYYKEILKIPKGYKPYYAIALGYKDVKVAKAPKRKENCIQYIE
ncbi:MAG: nitroreductase family protein [Candidatus Bathyarchaeota archaeon]|nr:nitroreductase family protein [Candidatus Bathyarchaeota archaeon]